MAGEVRGRGGGGAIRSTGSGGNWVGGARWETGGREEVSLGLG